ncbi:hypothetical protein SAMN05216167_12056 [Spirosoma endophyticum]|uniref:Uncharacterized protein n=1 Tax=Spirosoma endophyticum TaxID=662367 RepID=A0A1I2DT73_9BACT|nr:hypothetical protein SAMN05216167_12056 [Spirosoma endophyticum]
MFNIDGVVLRDKPGWLIRREDNFSKLDHLLNDPTDGLYNSYGTGNFRISYPGHHGGLVPLALSVLDWPYCQEDNKAKAV